jgi:hypothetical protein
MANYGSVAKCLAASLRSEASSMRFKLELKMSFSHVLFCGLRETSATPALKGKPVQAFSSSAMSAGTMSNRSPTMP